MTNVPKPNVFLPLHILARPSVPLFFCRVTQQLQLSAACNYPPSGGDDPCITTSCSGFRTSVFFFTFRVREESESSLLDKYRYVSYGVPIVGDTRDMYNTCGTWRVRVDVETGKKKPKIQTLSLLRRRRWNCQYLFIKTAAAADRGRRSCIPKISSVHTYRG